MKKHLLLGSVAMMVVSIVALSSATFAWFTASRTPTIEQVQIKITRSDDLKIAATADGTFYNYLLTSVIEAAAPTEGNWDTTLGVTGYQMEPVTPVYADPDVDGTLDLTSNELSFQYMSFTAPVDTDTNDTWGAGDTFARDGVVNDLSGGDSRVTDRNTQYDYVKFNVYFKATSKQDIYLDCYNTKVSTLNATGEQADADAAMRIACVNAAGDISIFEPNDTKEGDSRATPSYADIVGTADYTLDGTSIGENYFDWILYNTKYATSYMTQSAATTAYTTWQSTRDEADEPAFGLKLYAYDPATVAADYSVTKVTIYIWMEGNDLDCVDAIAGGNITLDFAFRGIPVA